jgi:hypothetical protein
VRACVRACVRGKQASKHVCTRWSIPFRELNRRLPQGKRLVCAHAHARARSRSCQLQLSSTLAQCSRPAAAFQREQRTPSQLERLSCINAHTLDVQRKLDPLHAPHFLPSCAPVLVVVLPHEAHVTVFFVENRGRSQAAHWQALRRWEGRSALQP